MNKKTNEIEGKITSYIMMFNKDEIKEMKGGIIERSREQAKSIGLQNTV